MSKSFTYPIGERPSIHVGEIATFDVLNASRKRKPKDTTETLNLLATHPTGWDDGFSVPVYNFADIPKDEPNREIYTPEAIVDARKAMLEELTEQAKSSGAVLQDVEVLKQMWMKDGKFIVPRVLNNACFTRIGLLRVVNRMRYMNKLPLILELPCVTKRYVDHVTRVEACLRENTLANQGTNKLSVADLLSAGQDMFNHGAAQIKFRPEGKDGEKSLFGSKGQAIFYACKLDSLFPNVRFIERLSVDDVEDATYLSFAKFNNSNLKEALDLSAMWDSDGTKFEEWIAEKLSANPKPRMLDSSKVETLERPKNGSVQHVLKAVRSGDMSIGGFIEATATCGTIVKWAYDNGLLLLDLQTQMVEWKKGVEVPAAK